VRRRTSARLTAVTIVALLGVAVGVNCSNGSNPHSSGDVKLAVVLPGGVHIDSVTYKVLSSANATIAGPGVFSVTDPKATISLDIAVPVTPTGDAGDEVVLTATDSLGNSCTGTSARFAVSASSNPAVTMTLACGSGTVPNATGNVGVTATVVEGDHCPNITSGVVGPDQTSVGATANVASTATDGDPGDTLTYAWAPAANFASPTSASTTYTCVAAGTQTFTLTVTDNHIPTPCSTQATFTITCVGTTNTGAAGSPATGGTTGTAGTTGAAGSSATGGSAGAAGTGGAMVVSCGAPTNGIWPDISGNGHDATLKNFGPGGGLVGDGTPANAYAVSFDGASNFAELAPGADGLRLTSEATLEIWVNNNFAEGVNSYDTMYSNRNGNEYSGFGAAIFNPGNTANSYWDVSFTTDGLGWTFLQPPGRPPSNTWIHFVTTFSVSQGFSRLFLNGVEVSSQPLPGPIVYSAAALPRVGGEAIGYNFRGMFGEIRIWSAALDASEVLARYQAGAPSYGIAAPSPTVTVTKPLALRLVATPCP